MTTDPSPVTLRLLRTKLFIPRPHAEVIARPRLLARLDAGLHVRLLLIAALQTLRSNVGATALALLQAPQPPPSKPFSPSCSMT